MKPVLLDTGPIVAFFTSSDPAHERSVEALNRFRGRFITTNAVITESMYFATKCINGPALLLELLEKIGTSVVDYCEPANLRLAVELMTQYEDTPMDFADATLILLAEALNQRDICTLDRRGFSTFRTPSGKRLNIVISEEGRK